MTDIKEEETEFNKFIKELKVDRSESKDILDINLFLKLEDLYLTFEESLYDGFHRSKVITSMMTGCKIKAEENKDEKDANNKFKSRSHFNTSFSPKKILAGQVVQALVVYLNVGTNIRSVSRSLEAKVYAEITNFIALTDPSGAKKASLARVALCFPSALYLIRKKFAKEGKLQGQFGTDSEKLNLPMCDPSLGGYFDNEDYMWAFHKAMRKANKKLEVGEESMVEFRKWQAVAIGGALKELSASSKVTDCIAADAIMSGAGWFE